MANSTLANYEKYAASDVFAPADGHCCVSVTERINASPRVEQEVLADKDLSCWLRASKQNAAPTLGNSNDPADGARPPIPPHRTLILFTAARPSEDIAKLSLSRDSFNAIKDAFEIPEVLLTFQSSAAAIVTDVHDENGNVQGIIFNVGIHALTVTYDYSSNTTMYLCLSLCQHQIDYCVSQLKTYGDAVNDPIAFAGIYMACHNETRFLRLRARRSVMNHMIKQSGIHWSKDISTFDPLNLETDASVAHLAVIRQELAWDFKCMKTLLRMLERVKLWRKTIATNGRSDPDVRRDAIVASRLATVFDMITAMQDLTEEINHLANDHSSTIYHFTNQRDSRLNMAQANASRVIAEQSLQDSKVMRLLAEASQKAALRARRDSNDMRIIACVTLIFLPATFTATLFSTSFFEFMPTPSSNIVSPWIWLYCVVTLGLTVFVIAGWYFISRRSAEEDEMHARLDQLKVQHPPQSQHGANGISGFPMTPLQPEHLRAPFGDTDHGLKLPSATMASVSRTPSKRGPALKKQDSFRYNAASERLMATAKVPLDTVRWNVDACACCAR